MHPVAAIQIKGSESRTNMRGCKAPSINKATECGLQLPCCLRLWQQKKLMVTPTASSGRVCSPGPHGTQGQSARVVPGAPVHTGFAAGDTQPFQSVSACLGNTCSGLPSARWHQQPGRSLHISAPCSVRQSPPGVWPNRPASERTDEGACGRSATALQGLIFHKASLRAEVSSAKGK